VCGGEVPRFKEGIISNKERYQFDFRFENPKPVGIMHCNIFLDCIKNTGKLAIKLIPAI
jgi:hypothetical protein